METIYFKRKRKENETNEDFILRIQEESEYFKRKRKENETNEDFILRIQEESESIGIKEEQLLIDEITFIIKENESNK